MTRSTISNVRIYATVYARDEIRRLRKELAAVDRHWRPSNGKVVEELVRRYGGRLLRDRAAEVAAGVEDASVPWAAAVSGQEEVVR